MLYVKTDRPLDPLTLLVMGEMVKTAQELGLQYFLCGAMARDVLLQHVHGIETGAATVDVDFGVAIEDWAQFEKIKANLIKTSTFEQDKKMTHRLYYRHNASNKGYPVDIIPFGGVESPVNRVAWPPDREEVLNVIAYHEALTNSVAIQVANDLTIQVTSLPGLALLKLFAWADRGISNHKDALDLVILLRTYYHAGNLDRLYGEEAKLLENVGFDLDAASPRLLGKDVQRIASPETHKQVMAIFNDEKMFHQLMTHMSAKLRGASDPIAAAERMLKQFKAGLAGH